MLVGTDVPCQGEGLGHSQIITTIAISLVNAELILAYQCRAGDGDQCQWGTGADWVKAAVRY